MLAFVAGATGYTGREVVRALAGRGIDCVAHVRPDSPRREEWRRRFDALGARTDFTEWRDDAMAATLRTLAPELVFALLGTTRARRRRTGDTYETVDYGLTALLLRATRRDAPRARFVYLSSVGVHDRTRNPYLKARARIEAELRGSGLDYVVVRPSFITGPDRDEARPLERAAAAGVDGVLAMAARLGARRLHARWRSRSGAELADALVRVALEGAGGRVVEAEEL